MESLDEDDEDYHIMVKTADFVNSIGIYKKTPLHFAVESGSLPCVIALVEQGGADVNIADS